MHVSINYLSLIVADHNVDLLAPIVVMLILRFVFCNISFAIYGPCAAVHDSGIKVFTRVYYVTLVYGMKKLSVVGLIQYLYSILSSTLYFRSYLPETVTN